MNADTLRLTSRNDALIAQPSGEIDLSNAEHLGDHIAEATTHEHVGVVLDLTDISFLDSFGIYVIIGLSQRLAGRGQAFVLVVPEDSPVQSALRISNLQGHLQIVAGVDEALSNLEAERSGA